MRKYNVCIVGIRGVVGQCMLDILQQRHFPVNELRVMSSNPDSCPEYIFHERKVKATKLSYDCFKGMEIGLFSPGAAVSKEYAPHAVKEGCVVIDNTSQFRMESDVPLVVPEVNPEDIRWQKGIIANPNCSTIQMVVALKPLHDYARLKRIVVSSYQAVSGAGREAVDELMNQMNGDMTVKKFQYQILNNVIPHIDVPQDNFYTKEEIKMVNETKKILNDSSIGVTATCVRVPVFGAHSESINIETERKISRQKAMEILSAAKGVKVIDDIRSNLYPVPLEAEGKDETFVGRIREDDTVECGLNLWVVADNLRKGAALNAIQIAEMLIKDGLI
ncbi:MAG: aspartate-semialdehyde dehydrogenase [Candidatus Omnitrophica bacterium]|nr:aspartate-semialdehyde dehydrogenase [Candidatus Omnitrophota bacterium]